MKRAEATAAIRAIIAALPDSELPKGRIEERGEETVLWLGGRGAHLGTAKSNGIREPEVHRTAALLDLFEGEAIYRADKRFLENGDRR